MPTMRVFVAALCASVLLLLGSPARAAEVVAAVAANFGPAMARLEPAFEQATGHDLTVVLGSSGKFLQQIQQGAPFDVFLSADAERPELLAKSGLGVPASRFTYAIGRLALWSPDPQAFSDGPAYLKAGTFRHLAIANPAVAPYGAAAQQALERLGLWGGLQTKIVRAEDIGQVYAMAGSGAAEAAFVAYSQVLSGGKPGSQWLVPQDLHQPLKQDAILITRAQNNPAAKALLDYLKTPAAREMIASLGYDLPAP
jgi:molybdate transport system substrate-binding protein